MHALMTKDEAINLASRAHARDARHRMKMRRIEGAIVRKSVVTLSAAGYGALHRFGIKDDVKGFPWKMGVWIGATLVEALVSSPLVQNIAAGVSDSTMAVYTERSIATKSFVAGAGGEV